MGHRLSKIYTRTGDSGTTGLGDGSRVPKDDLRIHALGDVDELNSCIGILRSQIAVSSIADKAKWDKSLSLIQHWLFDLGGEVCIPNYNMVLPISVEFLEKEIDAMNEYLPPLTNFILPGGHPIVSSCHVARTVCRRAERITTLMAETFPVMAIDLKYLNRLSDYFFVLARHYSWTTKSPELLWNTHP